VKIDIWSDVICPWCYVGKRNLEHALADLEIDPEIRWRAFELDPTSPPGTSRSLAEAMAAKFGVEVSQAEEMNAQMTKVAAQAGLDYRLDIARPGNSFDAHRLAKLAEEQGLGGVAAERLFSAYFTEGALLSDHAVLVDLGEEIGLDADEVRSMLDSDRFTDAVRSDEALAADAGFSGVPTIVIDDRFAIPGAQPPDVLIRLLTKIQDGEQR
jgi:protein disulfide-isomerase